MKGLMRMFAERVRHDGLPWTIGAAAHALARRIRSAWAARILGAPGLSLGPHCRLLGVRHTRWGRDVSVLGGLWLEAVTEYAGAEFRPVVIIGDRVRFSEGVHITAIERIEIGCDVLFGSRVFIGDHQHGSYGGDIHSDPGQPPALRPLVARGAVVIEDGVWIGDGAHILGPCRIGKGAVIGAYALVRADVPPRTIVAGAPARVVKVFDDRSERWIRPVSAGPGARDRTASSAAAPDSSSPS